MKILEFIFSGFWTWLGFVIVLSIVLKGLLFIYSRTLRFFSIRKHGYPLNCDADGDSVYCKNGVNCEDDDYEK